MPNMNWSFLLDSIHVTGAAIPVARERSWFLAIISTQGAWRGSNVLAKGGVAERNLHNLSSPLSLSVLVDDVCL